MGGVYLSVCVSLRLSVCPSVCLSVCMSVRLYVRLYVCLPLPPLGWGPSPWQPRLSGRELEGKITRRDDETMEFNFPPNAKRKEKKKAF